ncbi:hypothetical protein GY45DRAFT_1290223, partial [Cubamyces sp. BRFM 1775]
MTTPDGNVRNLSGRQARWLEHISEFNFSIEYVPGVENVLADALSWVYSNDHPGTVRAASEYTLYDDNTDLLQVLQLHAISMPVLVDLEARAAIELANTETGERKHPEHVRRAPAPR